MDEDAINTLKEFVKGDGFKELVGQVFTEHDKDGSGSIDQGEMMDILGKLHAAIVEGGAGDVPAPTEDQVQAVIAEFDASEDGKLQLDEFKKFLKALFDALIEAASA